MADNKIKKFTDLLAWQEAHKLAIIIYKTTDEFPSKETYSLTNQMRRASVSVSSNIAEGFGRQTYKEKVQFYYLAHGSLTELENQILLSKDIGYLSEENFSILQEQADQTHRLLIGLIKKSKTYLHS